MPSTWAALKEALLTLVYPWIFMSLSARHIPLTVRTLLAEGRFLSLLSPWAFCDALFGHFWATAGPLVKNSAEVRVIPLLEGRVSNGQVSESVVGTPVGGTVVEIGAGSGNWVDVFLKINTDSSGDKKQSGTTGGGELRNRGRSNGITKIYGVEPHPQSAAALRKRVQDVGLDDIYEVIPLGIESLSDPASPHPTTIAPGSVDCIVSVLCLCSIPDQEENIRALYKLLKPGGRWYVYEHVKAKRGGPLLKLYQRKCFTAPSLADWFWLVLLVMNGWMADPGSPRLRQHSVVLLHRVVPPVLSHGRQSAQGWALVQDRCRPAAGRASIRPSPTHSGNVHQVEASSTSTVYDHRRHIGWSMLN